MVMRKRRAFQYVLICSESFVKDLFFDRAMMIVQIFILIVFKLLTLTQVRLSVNFSDQEKSFISFNQSKQCHPSDLVYVELDVPCFELQISLVCFLSMI